jgi:glycosyltransferase involved in cell wall biosynthesis
MKVCLVGSGIVQIPPKRGGAVERIIYDIAQTISKEHNVVVLDFGEKEERIEEDGFEIWRIPISKTSPFLQKLKFGLKALFKIKQLNPDIVHLHTVFSGLPIALFKPTRLIYTCHNPSWVINNPGLGNLIVNKLETFIMKKADRVTTVSLFMKNCLIQKAGLPENKIRKIYNGVKIYSGKKPESAEEEKPIVLFLGKHTKHKGIHIFIEACSLINEEIPIRAVSVGPFGRFGEKGKKFWEKSDLVEFHGAVSEEKKLELLKKANVALYPTDRESLGIVFLESQALGVPVVATDLPVCHESINHGRTGLLVKRNPRSFAEAAKRILKENWKKTHAEEFPKWIKKFSKERIGREWLEFYRELSFE